MVNTPVVVLKETSMSSASNLLSNSSVTADANFALVTFASVIFAVVTALDANSVEVTPPALMLNWLLLKVKVDSSAGCICVHQYRMNLLC